MKKVKGMKYYFIAAAIALLAVFVAAPAGAGDQDRRLFGDYTYNIAATCVHAACDNKDCQSASTWGFNPVTLALRVPGSQRSTSYNIQSVIRFDGLGKFTLNGEGLDIRSSLGTPNSIDIPANQFDLICDGTYTVDSVGNEKFVNITFEGCTATIKSGLFGILGFTQKLTGPITVRGRLDAGTGSSPVTISNTIPYIEEGEVTAALGPLTSLIGSKEQRICNNMGSMEKLSPLK
jgi:hypothetical protein